MKLSLSLLLLFISSQIFSQGNCTQEEIDAMITDSLLVAETGSNCAINCFISFNQAQCIATCVDESFTFLELTDSCETCLEISIQCGIDSCWTECLLDSIACRICMMEKCGQQILDCSGDGDGDGILLSSGDCDDTDPSIYPGAEEIPNDGIDQDCDGEDLIVGISEHQNEISIFQSRNTLSIECKSGIWQFEIFDALGRRHEQGTLISGGTSHIFLREKGLLILRLRSQDRVITRKFVNQ